MQVRVPSKNKINQNRKCQKPKAMKHSSILMSSFGALLIMISVRESSIDFSKTNQNTSTIQPTAVIHKTSRDANVQLMEATHKTSFPEPAIPKGRTEINYLKFDVSEFVIPETANEDMPEDTDLSYLKFNASGNMETDTEIGALPEDPDLGYLKFDVNHYATNTDSGQELPSADFGYLKFDVQKYVQHNSECEINELPE